MTEKKTKDTKKEKTTSFEGWFAKKVSKRELREWQAKEVSVFLKNRGVSLDQDTIDKFDKMFELF